MKRKEKKKEKKRKEKKRKEKKKKRKEKKKTFESVTGTSCLAHLFKELSCPNDSPVSC